jgi:general secretion pathway protein G
LRRELPLDPWDFPYVFISPGDANPDSYDLMSTGADGQIGGEGEDADIHAWD